MGRKIDMKRIEDVTKCQVTFSKRRSSLMKKANETAVCCDVDVAFVAFSPAGRISKYCNQKRIEDVLLKYVNLPADKRLTHIDNVQAKLEKLKNLSHIKSDTSKLDFLDKQIENIELQIKKCGLESQILEAELRDYEVSPDQKPSLHQLCWCERNLNNSLEKITARKLELANQSGIPFSSNLNENELDSTIQNPSTFLMKLDPWISPFSSTFRETLFQDLLDQEKRTPNMNPGPSNVHNSPTKSDICNFLFPDSQIPFQQCSVVDQAALKFLEKNNADGWDNLPQVPFSDAIHMSTQSLSNFQSPRFMSTTKATNDVNTVEIAQSGLYDEMETCLQFTNSNFNQLNNLMEGQGTGQINFNYDKNNASNGKTNNGDCSREMHKIGQLKAPYQGLQPENEVGQDTLLDYLPHEDTLGENAVATSKIQNCGLWELEDLLFDENFNPGDFLK